MKGLRFFFTAFVASILGYQFALAFYEASDTVITLDSDKFEAEVLGSEDIWVVEFYAPWCQHCQQFAPVFEKLAGSLEKFGVKVGAVDADEHKKVSAGEGVQGFPTIKFYVGKGSLNPYTKKMWRPSQVYSGDRSESRKIQRALFKALPEGLVVKVTSDSFEEFKTEAKNSGLNQVLAFTERTSTSPLLLSIANEFKGRIAFGEVHSSEEGFAEDFEVDEFPTLLVVTLEGERIKFTGDPRQWKEVRAFCESYAKEAPTTEDSSEGMDQGTMPQFVTGPVELGTGNFTEEVLESASAWVVVYLGAGQTVEDLPSWSKHSKAFEGMIQGGFVNCETSQGLCEEEEETPYIRVFPYDKTLGDMKESGVTKYPGNKLSKALSKAGDSLPNLVMVVPPEAMGTGGPAGGALQQAVSLSMNHGKIPMVVASKKSEPNSAIKSLGVEFEEFFQIIFLIDPPAEVTQQMGNLQVPGMLIMQKSGVVGQEGDTQEVRMGLMMYSEEIYGPMNYQNMASFMVQAMMSSGNADEIREKLQKGSDSSSAPKKKKKVMKITPENWEEVCPVGASSLCVVSFLDGYADEATTEEWVGILKSVMEKEVKMGGSPFEFSYTMGNCDLPFAQAFEIDPSMHLPAVVVYSPKKDRFVRHVGRFDQSSIQDFLRGVVSNRIKTGPIYQTPVPGNAECEDISNLDDEAMMEEEDMSDFMAEILEEERKEKERLNRELKEEQEKEKLLEEAEKKKAAEEDASKKKKNKKKQSEL
eukprot:CAMPEP_0117801490 /NCGR_PEP_ID=MMETSP0948-20121206/15121_1 /TAXON_ID=44440 /ORGANISM="Chattonella subsalsa, Strain CCMP2191" /LENGTH=753 /DNA_ID=CAMNT_0005634019 /DNA_START=186 /DNA_END=2447 /DNA_ORIENTATION=+